jgi:hypothetical protein
MVDPVLVCRNCPEMAPILIVLLILFASFVLFAVTAIKILIFCKIFSKAGYSWALGLVMLVPIANIIMAFFLAFADWPVCKEVRGLKQQLEKSKA